MAENGLPTGSEDLPGTFRSPPAETRTDVTVVTPSLNMLSYLKRCSASIRDQAGINIQHIVVDGGSDDGTIEWLERNVNIVRIVGRDNGMYDAINKGFDRANGAVVAYLNCDEQYLPYTLRFVRDYFDGHPEVDILFGDTLLVRPDGHLISYRKGYQPRWCYIVSSYLYVLSCSMFLRRRIISSGVRFDNKLKNVGDGDLVLRLLRGGYRAVHVPRYLAAFTMTGRNMSGSQNARLEARRALRAAPLWVRLLRYPLNAVRLAEKFSSGAYFQTMPLEYSIFDSDEAQERKAFRVWRASFRWRTQ